MWFLKFIAWVFVALSLNQALAQAFGAVEKMDSANVGEPEEVRGSLTIPSSAVIKNSVEVHLENIDGDVRSRWEADNGLIVFLTADYKFHSGSAISEKDSDKALLDFALDVLLDNSVILGDVSKYQFEFVRAYRTPSVITRV